MDTSPTPDMSDQCVRDPVVFPAALAARALSITPSATRVLARAFDFLVHEMHPDGLWRHPSSDKEGYDALPHDVDDTSLASVAFAAVGRPLPDNRAIVLANRERNGLFLTWIVRKWPLPEMTSRFFRDTPCRVDDVDAVVNANVVMYLGDREETRPAIEHMLEVLRGKREMATTKWYQSPFTVWYFFSHALREIAPEAGELIVPRIAATTPANALEIASAVSTLLLWDQVPDVQPLLDTQLRSGAWPRAGFYHMGLRAVSPTESRPTPPWWGSEAMTTIFAVEALTRYSNRIEGESALASCQ
jgi:hypothetical protein